MRSESKDLIMLTAGLAEGSREGANAWANAWQIHTSLSESLMRMEKNITSWVISTAICFQRLFTQALLNITDIYNLKQLITEPTRITPLSSTLIDVIFTNLPDNTTCSGVSHIGISDHSLIYVYRKISSPSVIKGTSTITYRQFKNFNRNTFRSDILG